MSTERAAPNQYEIRLIQLLRRLFELAKFKVKDHFSVGELPLEIDMIVITASEAPPSDFSELPPLFHYFRRYNVMELKTEADPIEIADLFKLQAYGWLYMMKEGLRNVAEITLTALVHHIPSGVMKALPKLGYQPIENGIFRRDGDMVTYLIPFNGLPDELTPEELRAFSNPVRRQPIILSEINRGQVSPLFDALIDLYQSEVFKIMAIKQETLDRFVETVGRDKVMALFSKEEYMAALSKGDHLAALSKGDLLAALSKEDHLAALSKEDLVAALSDDDMLKRLLAKFGTERLSKMLEQARPN